MKVRLTAEATLEVSKEDLRDLRKANPYSILKAIYAEDKVRAQVKVVGGRWRWPWGKA